MKNKWVIVCSILALTLGQARSQTSGGGGTSGGGTSSGTTTSGSSSSGQNSGTASQQPSTRNPVNPQPSTRNGQVTPGQSQQLPPGLQNRQGFPPGLQTAPLPPGIARRNGISTNQAVTSTNQESLTNEFVGSTNEFGNTNLSQTGNSGTNRIFSTNTFERRFDARHFDRMRFRDIATTPSDQNLLIKIKQTITTEISVSTSGGVNWIPIHIAVDSGRVTLTGVVASDAQAQQIQSLVSQMPGVAAVQNALNTLPQDMAISESDRVILTQIRQVIPLSPPTGAFTPVTFDVRQGVVAIAGIVPTVQESQRIETVVRQVPGVVNTSNTLIVDTASGARATSTSSVRGQ